MLSLIAINPIVIVAGVIGVIVLILLIAVCAIFTSRRHAKKMVNDVSKRYRRYHDLLVNEISEELKRIYSIAQLNSDYQEVYTKNDEIYQNVLKNEDYNVVALIGDGALTGGLSYEALNDAGVSGEPLVVILNDNGMAITLNEGGIAHHLSMLRMKPGYVGLKNTYKNIHYNKLYIYLGICHYLLAYLKIVMISKLNLKNLQEKILITSY